MCSLARTSTPPSPLPIWSISSASCASPNSVRPRMKPSVIALKRVVLVDTGPLVAAIDAGDSHHAWAKATLPKLTGRLYTCEAVASEAGHLLDNDPAALVSLHGFLKRMEIVPVLRDELDEVFARLKRYA